MITATFNSRAVDSGAVLTIARAIAQLANGENITAEHLTEAIHYRRLDRRL